MLLVLQEVCVFRSTPDVGLSCRMFEFISKNDLRQIHSVLPKDLFQIYRIIDANIFVDGGFDANIILCLMFLEGRFEANIFLCI